MRRTQASDDSQTVSLFPFLAVLLSTMGALLIVLVVMARQARLDAAQEEKARGRLHPAAENAGLPVGPSPSELEALREASARLTAIRDEGRREFEASRLRLRHGDVHLRQLQEEVASLYRQARDLEQLGTARLDDRAEAQSELVRLGELVRETQSRLEEERRAAAEKPKSYAIIPYEGPHGTRRRPLYIECRRDSVVLQPEGVTLDEADFLGPLGPGNPLACALRAADDYYATSAQGENADAEPYPLILVRPDGIAAYYFVRKALEGWGTDFGYELLDGNWKLEFPLPNPALANAEQHAVNLARGRQQALALAAPGRFGGGGIGAGEGLGDFDAGSFSGFSGSSLAAADGEALGAGGSGGPGSHEPMGQRYALAEWDQGEDGRQSLSAAGTSQPPSTSPSSTTTDNAQAGQQPHEQKTSNNGAATSPGGSRGIGGPAPIGSPSGSAHPGGMSGAPSAATGGMPGSFSVGAADDYEPLANSRGRNWALPQAGLGSVPIRRAIHVVVRHNQLAILPGQGTLPGRVIPMDSSVESGVDPLIEGVAEQLQSWGTAGRGLYWQPVLVFKSGPDATAHTAALRRLLFDSGLEIAP